MKSHKLRHDEDRLRLPPQRGAEQRRQFRRQRQQQALGRLSTRQMCGGELPDKQQQTYHNPVSDAWAGADLPADQ